MSELGLKKRNGIYYADYYAGGKRVRTSLGTGVKRVAENLYAELLVETSRSRLGLRPSPKKSRGSVKAHLADYLDHLERHGGRGGAPAHLRHVKEVRSTLERFVRDRQLVELFQLTIHEGEAWLRGESSRPTRRGRKAPRVSSRTLERQASALKAWGKWLYDQRRTETHVMLGLKHVVAAPEQLNKRHPRRPLTDEELDRVLGLCPPYRRLVWLFMARTGLRAEEATQLKWRDVLGLGTPAPKLRLRNSATKNKRGGQHPLSTEAARDLLRWRKGEIGLGIYKRYFHVAQARRGLNDPVFPIVPPIATWKRDLELAGVPYETAEGKADRHSLRMKFGTDLINSGTPPQVVMALMRHSSIKLTLELYAFASDDQRREAVEQLGGAA